MDSRTRIFRFFGVAAAIAILSYTTSCNGGGCTGGPDWDPDPVPDTEYCWIACEHIGPSDGGLNCPEGLPLEMKPDACAGADAGATGDCISCQKFCEDTQNNGVWLNPRCVVNIQECSQIDSCQEVKK